MTADLDTRIRALVLEVVDQTPPPPELSLGEPVPTSSRRPPVWALIALVVVAIVVAAALITVSASGGSDLDPASTVTIPLRSVPEGVSARRVRGTPVFLVRNGKRVMVFISSAQHLENEQHLLWCPKADVFYSPTHGETFDRNGVLLYGPAKRGLDQLEVSPVGNAIKIKVGAVLEGLPRGTAGTPRSVPLDNGEFCGEGLSAPGTYGSGAK